jgi:hypothetical protein
MLSCTSNKLGHMCVVLGFGIRGWIKRSDGWGGPTLKKNCQLTCCMGLECREVRILAQRATIPSKSFFQFESTHILIFICCTVLYNMVCFSPVQIKIKHVMKLRMCFSASSILHLKLMSHDIFHFFLSINSISIFNVGTSILFLYRFSPHKLDV